MSTNSVRPDHQTGGGVEAPEVGRGRVPTGHPSRRTFLTAAAAGLAGASLKPTPLAGVQAATAADLQDLTGDARRRRILLKGGVVFTLDPKVGDFERADVLIDGKLIADIAPNITVADAEIVDCSGTIVMPGFITTHHHQYETIQRSIIPDGRLNGAWPQETYGSVVQNIWTAGRIPEPGTPGNPGKVIWDLGRVPYDPEDCYISEVVACLSEISEGITCGTDTSQANHTPEYTDAMIKGLMDSGRRSVFDYSGGTNRSAEGFPYEAPGAMNDTTKGIGRLAKTYFSSKDQLVTLGFGGGSGPAFEGASYTGWQLGRSFGALINSHGGGGNAVEAAKDPRNGTDWSDVTAVHCTRWQDESYAQIGAGNSGYPNKSDSARWKIWPDRGAHVSIANIIEMQMGHGMPPFQIALNHGILPSLSPDVDTNMTTDPFSLMRGAFCLQRALANDLAFKESNPGNIPMPQLRHIASVHRDGHHCGGGGEPDSRQGRHARARQRGRHHRARRAEHQHLADEQRAGDDRDDDEPPARARRPDCGEGRVLARQARRVGHRKAAEPDRAIARPRARPNQRPGQGRRDTAGGQHFGQPVPAELPGKLLLQGTEQDGPRVRPATVSRFRFASATFEIFGTVDRRIRDPIVWVRPSAVLFDGEFDKARRADRQIIRTLVCSSSLKSGNRVRRTK